MQRDRECMVQESRMSNDNIIYCAPGDSNRSFYLALAGKPTTTIHCHYYFCRIALSRQSGLAPLSYLPGGSLQFLCIPSQAGGSGNTTYHAFLHTLGGQATQILVARHFFTSWRVMGGFARYLTPSGGSGHGKLLLVLYYYWYYFYC